MTATQAMRAMGPTQDSMQPLPSLPSPTLTNPEMVLPKELPKFPSLPSPPRNVRRDRPPSPSYLKEQTSETTLRARSGSNGNSAMPVKKEKRGLMSRKMMLLRSRTASNGVGVKSVEPTSQEQDSTYASSPTIVCVNSLAAAQSKMWYSSNGESPTDSDDMAALPQFLAKYDANNMSSTDDELESSPAVARHDYAESNFTSNLEEERRQKEEEEQQSAILSKRAEQILANAKKRLNLMEGNLRGARDLVAPLTAANLRRATSVASYVPPPASFGGRNRYVQDPFYHDAAAQPNRTLQTQASSPTMARDFQGHWRGFSETELPERSYNALDDRSSPIIAQGYIPTKAHDPLWTKTLKGSRSHDSLGHLALRRPGSRDPFYSKNSPEPNLEPLVEDDGPTYQEFTRSASSQADSRDGSNGYRGSSTPEDLHEQMSSLKGRISALKERAREDSIRRQSMQNLRDPSPLNNATADASEVFYASSPTYSAEPAPESQPSAAPISQRGHLDRFQSYETVWEPTPVASPMMTGSRNAFAEQAQRMLHNGNESTSRPTSAENTALRSGQNSQASTMHKRTPSGSAIIQSSKHRYSHHQLYHVRDMQGTYGADEPLPQDAASEVATETDGVSRYGDDEDSQAGASVYEEAQEEPHQPVVAHEDRDDAFDYEHFFLHSAMAYYSEDAQRWSTSSEEEGSVDSLSTARGPTAAAEQFDDDERFDAEGGLFPPSIPQTPERLREIERTLHSRTLSNESISTSTSFATATEGLETPEITTPEPDIIASFPTPHTAEEVRPSTAVSLQQPRIALSDTSSERNDSGVSVSGSQHPSKRTPGSVPTHKPSLSSSSMTNATLSPPVSPRGAASQDPATVAVNALLAPSGGQLGLRDKALLFGLVESLKKVCQSLQDGNEASQDSRMLRRRLDDARRVLAGSGEVRPGTS